VYKLHAQRYKCETEQNVEFVNEISFNETYKKIKTCLYEGNGLIKEEFPQKWTSRRMLNCCIIFKERDKLINMNY